MTMTRSQSVLSSRSLALGVLAAAALALAGCGSRVKLDDKASGAAPITSAAPGEGAGAGGVASSNVAPVVVAPDANDAAASNIVISLVAIESPFTYHLSLITYHLSLITYHCYLVPPSAALL